MVSSIGREKLSDQNKRRFDSISSAVAGCAAAGCSPKKCKRTREVDMTTVVIVGNEVGTLPLSIRV